MNRRFIHVNGEGNRVCDRCDKKYKPTGKYQKYCDVCSKSLLNKDDN